MIRRELNFQPDKLPIAAFARRRVQKSEPPRRNGSHKAGRRMGEGSGRAHASLKLSDQRFGIYPSRERRKPVAGLKVGKGKHRKA
jgi:hypothetical protein